MSPTKDIPTNVDTTMRAAKRRKEGNDAAEVRARMTEAGRTTQTRLPIGTETKPAQTLDEDLPLPSTRRGRPLNGEDETIETGEPMDIAFVFMKNNTPSTTYCSEKGCHAHAKRMAPEDGKAYCDVCVSNKMKEPKPEKAEDKAKKIGVSGGG